MRLIAGLLFAAVATAPLAQHQPYGGQQGRDLKALSASEVQQYLQGAGMGSAKAAELNHYPGPAHVLELADQLELSPAQRAEVMTLRDSHHAQAVTIGAKLVEAERNLDALFRRGDVGAAELEEAARGAASLQGEYRLSHLETHRRLRALLTDEQVSRYDHLRGYGARREPGHSSH
jgi:hypothetical protein